MLNKGWRFGRLGTAGLLLSLPIILPAAAIYGALMGIAKELSPVFSTIPNAVRFVLTGE